MSLKIESLDSTSWQILKVLQKHGRISYSELGKIVGLSTPAVSERVRKLEEIGAIERYQAVVNPRLLGYEITALVSIKTAPVNYGRLIGFAERSGAVTECHYITGDASFVLKIVVQDIKEMERFIGEVSHIGTTNTSVVMSTNVDGKILTDKNWVME